MKPAAIVLGLAVLACAASARAETQFDYFKSLCIDTRANAGAAIAKADQIGWKPAPSTLLAELSKPSEPSQVTTGVDGRMRQDEAGLIVLVVAHTNRIVPNHDIPGDVCAVGAGPNSDGVRLKADATAFAQVPETPAVVADVEAGDAAGFLWREVEGRHAGLEVKDIEDAAADGSATILVAVSQGGIGLLGLAVPVK